MHMICRFKAWEVRNPELQTVRDLDLKRRSYGRLKTTMQSWAGISHLEIQSAKNPFQGAKISHLEIQNAEMTNYLLNPFLNTQDSVFHS